MRLPTKARTKTAPSLLLPFIIILLSLLSTTTSFAPSIFLSSPSLSKTSTFLCSSSPSTQNTNKRIPKHTLVLLRHGESTWNNENRFTGWVDVPLSPAGRLEAHAAGKVINESALLKGGFTRFYTSMLTRAQETLGICLGGLLDSKKPTAGDGDNNTIKSWRLNERHYGALQGLNKLETVSKFGPEQVNIWRRSYDIPPPSCESSKDDEHYPGNNELYNDVDKNDLPVGESLKMTKDRFLPLWNNEISNDMKNGERLLICAHGNTIRSLVMHLDNISSDDITGVNIPTGVPLVYHLDENLEVCYVEGGGVGGVNGVYLGDREAIKERIEGVKKQSGAK